MYVNTPLVDYVLFSFLVKIVTLLLTLLIYNLSFISSGSHLWAGNPMRNMLNFARCCRYKRQARTEAELNAEMQDGDKRVFPCKFLVMYWWELNREWKIRRDMDPLL
jgi:hypothetical protein